MILILKFVGFYSLLFWNSTIVKPLYSKVFLATLCCHERKDKELRLDTFTSLESRELSVKPLLTVKHEMLVVQSEMQLVNTCRKESEGFEASLDWLWSCLK